MVDETTRPPNACCDECEETLRRVLERARRELLDLTNRNRLLSTPRKNQRSKRIEVIGEDADDIYRILVQEGKSMWFRPAQGSSASVDAELQQEPVLEGLFDQSTPGASQPQEMPQPENDTISATTAVHGDRYLQTGLSSTQLQSRLLQLYYDARTYEEEQGVNILYLAMGFLSWYEDENSDVEHQAPLILIPVRLHRDSAWSRFRIEYTGDELSTNLSLQERLWQDFALEFPDLPDAEDLVPSSYFKSVEEAVAKQPRWSVKRNDMVVWFFSFLKYLMFLDLDPRRWPKEHPLERRPLIRGLLYEGFRDEGRLFDENKSLDDLLQPIHLHHVLDADSSQAEVIEEVKQGRNLVVQGPPGTGKSQTITNIIAEAVVANKSVLFVAEKLAALQVVKRRLENIGLGDICLELHSQRANKRAVVDELRRTLELGKPQLPDVGRTCQELIAHRDRLNRCARALHTPIAPTDITPYQALGTVVFLRQRGVAAPAFVLPEARSWPRAVFEQKDALLEDLGKHFCALGDRRNHPWRGVQCGLMLPTEVQRLVSSLGPLINQLERLQQAAERVGRTLEYDSVLTLQSISDLARWALRILQAPDMDRRSLDHPVWTDRRNELDQLVQQVKQWSHFRAALAGKLADCAWHEDVQQLRMDLAAYGESWLRWFYPRYRRARRRLRGLLVGRLPRQPQACVELLDTLIQEQQCRKYLQDPATRELGASAFGSYWRELESDWQKLEAITKWQATCRNVHVPAHFFKVHASLEDTRPLSEAVTSIQRELRPAHEALKQIVQQLKLDVQEAFAKSNIIHVPVGELIDRLRQWQLHHEEFSAWANYYIRLQLAKENGLEQIASRLDSQECSPQQARDTLRMIWCEELLRVAFQESPLSDFNGLTHEQIVARFQRLDEQRIELARCEVAMAHYERLPHPNSDAGEMATLRHEMSKKRHHMPLRKLLQSTGHAVQRIKPVFMMSPLSIAQYLEPGSMEFDLVVMDEASQIRPVEALGAIARGKQLVVVGDDRQLPPTTFFDRLLGETQQRETEQEEQPVSTADLESILDLCRSQGMASRMLRWHYRSRHPSLIALPNSEFYENKLYVVPSPFRERCELGLSFCFVEGGVYDRGGSATNLQEAQVVADAIMQHARQFPNKSLGVGTFSVAQRDAILAELERRRRQSHDTEPFFSPTNPEPFFVKNLENIQGDERDVVFISVGYGRDQSGYMAMYFGPLSQNGGERRLNVLITRARERCCVFSSIRHDDIDLTRTDAAGVRALKRFLKFAETGQIDLPFVSGNSYQSPFEEAVANAIQQLGYQVHAQVGSCGFYLDLAVVHPNQPGRYVLGIECDGASYHSSRWARDRDRLRQKVLEDQGWKLHRIWSTDWFRRPDDQLRITVAAIEKAAAVLPSAREDRTSLPGTPPSRGGTSISRDESDPGQEDEPGEPVLTVPYRVADFSLDVSRLPENRLSSAISDVVRNVLEIEAPMSMDELARRVAKILGMSRAGPRVQESVENAVLCQVDQQRLVYEGGFIYKAGEANIPIRDRSKVPLPSLKRPDALPPREIQAAIVAAVGAHIGMTSDELVSKVARLLGFRMTSPAVRQVIEEEVRFLQQKGMIHERNLRFYVSASLSPNPG